MTRNSRSIVAALAGLAGFAAGCAGTDRPEQTRLAELQVHRRQLHMQFLGTQTAIRDVQARALAEPGVVAAKDAFYETIRAVIERDEPNGTELLERAAAVGHDLDRLTVPSVLLPGQDVQETANEKLEVAAELAEVERSLRPVLDRAFRDRDVAERFQVLQDSVVAAILRLDPAAEGIIETMRDLERRMGEIDAEMRDLSG
jgi:hypothetical protein